MIVEGVIGLNLFLRGKINSSSRVISKKCPVLKDEATSMFSPLNKTEKSIDGVMIKEFCVKLKVDRLGNISI